MKKQRIRASCTINSFKNSLISSFADDITQFKQNHNRFTNLQGQPLYKVPNQPVYPSYPIQPNSAFVSWNREQNYLPQCVSGNYPNVNFVRSKENQSTNQNGIVYQRLESRKEIIKPSKNLFMPTFKNNESTKQEDGKSPQVNKSPYFIVICCSFRIK